MSKTYARWSSPRFAIDSFSVTAPRPMGFAPKTFCARCRKRSSGEALAGRRAGAPCGSAPGARASASLSRACCWRSSSRRAAAPWCLSSPPKKNPSSMRVRAHCDSCAPKPVLPRPVSSLRDGWGPPPGQARAGRQCSSSGFAGDASAKSRYRSVKSSHHQFGGVEIELQDRQRDRAGRADDLKPSRVAARYLGRFSREGDRSLAPLVHDVSGHAARRILFFNEIGDWSHHLATLRAARWSRLLPSASPRPLERLRRAVKKRAFAPRAERAAKKNHDSQQSSEHRRATFEPHDTSEKQLKEPPNDAAAKTRRSGSATPFPSSTASVSWKSKARMGGVVAEASHIRRIVVESARLVRPPLPRPRVRRRGGTTSPTPCCARCARGVAEETLSFAKGASAPPTAGAYCAT